MQIELSAVKDLSTNRVVITGIGLVTPLGATRELSWQALKAGQRGIRDLQPEDDIVRVESIPQAWPDLKIGAPRPVSTWDHRYADPVIALAEQTAAESLADANLTAASLSDNGIDPERCGCVIGTSKGGLSAYSHLTRAYNWDRNLTEIDSHVWPACWPNAAAVSVANTHGIRGPLICPVAACATGLISIMRGVELIATGICDVVLAGSSDAALHPGILAAFHRLGVLSRNFIEPAEACKPFDRNRDGFAVGEGAAVFVLESAEHAASRNQRAYGKWIGSGMACDPTGITEMDTQAESLTRLVEIVLEQADVSPQEIDYLNLHGTATQQNDLIEATALHRVFGSRITALSCSSLKGACGHLLGAAGSVELALSLLAMRDNIVPPTMNCEQPDPALELDVTPNVAIQKPINQIMKLSLGFGGHLAAAIVRKSGNEKSF